MKKISGFIKDNYKFLIGVIVGLLLSGTGVYAANTIYSKNVTYDNSNSGLSATNVQDALDETYNKCIPPTAADDIINLYNDGSSINTVHIGGDESNPQVKLNETQGIMLDNNGDYRYYGANPNNYVTFNGETWRIIGAFYDVDDGTGTKATRLKIIRNESIGKYSWDSDNVNDWSKSDLMNELNTLYYNSQSGNCYTYEEDVEADNYGVNLTACDFTSMGLDEESRNMIDNAVWHLGGVIVPVSEYANYFYNYERGTEVYNCSTDDGACPRATTWTGKIGLMYPSDYLYGADLNVCMANCMGYNNCIPNNWFVLGFYKSEYTITPSSNQNGGVKYVVYKGIGQPTIVGSSASISNWMSIYSMEIRPVLYLKSSITITGGSGTSSDPYTLE